MVKRASKQTHRRNKPRIQPDRHVDDELFGKCLEFANRNSSLALDDSYDRAKLAEAMAEFIRFEIFDAIDLGGDEFHRRELEEDDPENFGK